MDWRQYQEETAEFFRSLGCEADVEAKVPGVRTEHKIDVWVRFNKFGIETKWVVECKYWNSSVTKEKVLALRGVVEDVGADRGILISTARYQRGAVRAAKKTNITLTNLDELKETAQEDLLASALHHIETRVIELNYARGSLLSLKGLEQTGQRYTGTIRVDRNASQIGANLSSIRSGLDRIRLQTPPYPIKYDETGERVTVDTVEEFVIQAYEILSEVEFSLNSQLASKPQ
jgi:hypothetical protein